MLTKLELNNLLYEQRFAVVDWHNIDLAVLKNYLEESGIIQELVLINVPSEHEVTEIFSILPNTVKYLAIGGENLGDAFVTLLAQKVKGSNIEVVNCHCPKLTDTGLETFFNMLCVNRDTIKTFYIHAGDASLKNICHFLYGLMDRGLKFGSTHGVENHDAWTYKGLISANLAEKPSLCEFIAHLSTLYLKMMDTGEYGVTIHGIDNNSTVEQIFQHIIDILDRLSVDDFQQYFGPNQLKADLLPSKRTYYSHFNEAASLLADLSIFTQPSAEVHQDEELTEELATKAP
jgi:hypothetical protein